MNLTTIKALALNLEPESLEDSNEGSVENRKYLL